MTCLSGIQEPFHHDSNRVELYGFRFGSRQQGTRLGRVGGGLKCSPVCVEALRVRTLDENPEEWRD